MKNLSDEVLVCLFAQGKNEAFDELLYRHQKKLFGYIMMFVHNREVAEDIFQDTFTKAIMTIKSGRYHESGRFMAYLTRIAHNQIIDLFRVEQNNQIVGESDVEYDIFNNKELSEASREEEISTIQIVGDLRRLIASLPDNQREVIIMRYYQDMSFKEIADATGVSINTALGRMRYAIINIRKMAADHNIALAV